MNSIYSHSHQLASSNEIVLYASVAILIGLMVKLGGFGLHIWLPSAYKEAPAPVAAALSALMSGIAGYALIRILAIDLSPFFATLSPYLIIWGIISLLYGGFVALSQDDVEAASCIFQHKPDGVHGYRYRLKHCIWISWKCLALCSKRVC